MEFAWTIFAVVGPSTEDILFQQVLRAVILTFFLDSVGIVGAFDSTDEADSCFSDWVLFLGGI